MHVIYMQNFITSYFFIKMLPYIYIRPIRIPLEYKYLSCITEQHIHHQQE